MDVIPQEGCLRIVAWCAVMVLAVIGVVLYKVYQKDRP